jgi:hypothetical protein
VRGTSRKYALDMLVLLSLWLVKARIELTQIEAVALEEAGFLFLEKPNVLLLIKLKSQFYTCEPTFYKCPLESL